MFYELDSDSLQYRVEIWEKLFSKYRTVAACTDPDFCRAALAIVRKEFPDARILIRQRSRVLFDSERDAMPGAG